MSFLARWLDILANHAFFDDTIRQTELCLIILWLENEIHVLKYTIYWDASHDFSFFVFRVAKWISDCVTYSVLSRKIRKVGGKDCWNQRRSLLRTLRLIGTDGVMRMKKKQSNVCNAWKTVIVNFMLTPVLSDQIALIEMRLAKINLRIGVKVRHSFRNQLYPILRHTMDMRRALLRFALNHPYMF